MVVWCRVPDRIIHLDLAVETIIQDADFAFVVVQDCSANILTLLDTKDTFVPTWKDFIVSH